MYVYNYITVPFYESSKATIKYFKRSFFVPQLLVLRLVELVVLPS